MKLRLPILLTSAVMACFAPVVSLGVDGFNINFVAVDGNPISGSDLIGLEGVGVAADNWNNITPSTANQWYEIEKDCEGNALNGLYLSTTKTMTTWTSGNKDTTLGEFLSNYHDDSGSTPYTITLSGVPYLETSVYLYMSGDGGTFSPMSVNGVTYIGADGDTVEGTGEWGDRSPNQTALVEGTNVLVVDDVVGGVIEISNVPGSGRGTIAGIQVVDSYEGVRLYRTLASGEFTWGDAAWSTTEGVAGSNPWADGAGHAAVINASAEGSSLSVEGEIALDGLIVQSGNLTLSGGTLSLIGPASIITKNGTDLTLDNINLKVEDRLSMALGGTLTLGENVTLSGNVLSLSGGNLRFASGEAVIAAGLHIALVGTTVDYDSLAIEEGASLDLRRNVFAQTTVTGGGTLILNSHSIAWAEDDVHDYSVARVELHSGETLFAPTQADGENGYMFGRELHVYSDAKLHFKLPDNGPYNSDDNSVSSTIVLHDGAEMQIGESNGSCSNVSFFKVGKGGLVFVF